MEFADLMYFRSKFHKVGTDMKKCVGLTSLLAGMTDWSLLKGSLLRDVWFQSWTCFLVDPKIGPDHDQLDKRYDSRSRVNRKAYVVR